MWRAKATASAQMRSRSSGSRFGAGAISTTFWWRRCTEQSRSKRWMISPSASPSTCTSTCRGSTTACSRNTAGSPKADSASRIAASIDSRSVALVCTRRMPRPPPPAIALTNTGKPTSSAAATSSSMSVEGGDDSSTGTPASRAAATARDLLPVSSSTRAGGPTKVIPARSHARASVGFPDRVALLTDLVGLVGLEPVFGVPVLVGEHRDGVRAQLVGGTERPDRDLPAVRDEDLAEHRSSLPSRGCLADTELVALGIAHRRPHRSPLVVVGTGRGTQCDQPGDLGLAVGGGQVDVYPVLAGLALGHPDEEPGRTIRHGGGPEPGEPSRLRTVERDVSKPQRHHAMLAAVGNGTSLPRHQAFSRYRARCSSSSSATRRASAGCAVSSGSAATTR